MNDNRRHDNDRSRESRARQDAYQEYLSLREHNEDRGSYVKDDTLYGSYIPNRSGNRRQHQPSQEFDSSGGFHTSIEDTPYGVSKMRQQRQSAAEEIDDRKPIARKGRVNKADKLTRAEKKARKKAQKEDAFFADGGNGGNGGNGSGGDGFDGGSKKRKKKKKKGRGLKIALIIVLILVLGIGGVIAAGLTVVKNTLDNVGRIELDPDLIGINPQVDSDLRNYRNIALLGIDARDMSSDENVRSDAIIVASINKETNEIKMFSIYRDTMLDLGDNSPGLDKVTHGYFYGGPTKMLYAINKNLDLNVKEVVVVNWKSVADTVDALGGLDINIKDSEIKEMNKYIQDTYKNIGGSNAKIETAGKQTLNGNQAVTYARIRKDSVDGDYRRNERMKIVVKAAFKKAAKMDTKALKKISNEILPEIKTNMSSADMMDMVLKLNSYEMTDSVGWPYDVGEWSHGGWYGPPVTLSSNVTKLHEQFFGQEGYTPTQDVQNISKRISAKTGLY